MNRTLQLLLDLALSAAPTVHAAQLLIHNGYTLNGAGKLQRFEALMVDEGKVVATGIDKALRKRAAAKDRDIHYLEVPENLQPIQ